NVSPLMGADLIITTFAIVVIGGMGSILGSVVTGFVVGVLSALGAVYYPPAANTLVFVLMAVVLLLRPSGLFGSPEAGRDDLQDWVGGAGRGGPPAADAGLSGAGRRH